MADSFARVRHIIGNTTAWEAFDIVLGDGEIGVERLSASDIRIKIGDGTKTWSLLPYASSSATGINDEVAVALDAKLAKTGGTMTGLLILSGNPSNALGAATKQYVDAINTALTNTINTKLSVAGGTMTGVLNLAGVPTANAHAANKSYVDTLAATKINKAGDTMTGALVLADDPTSAMHAATKQYVDSGAYQTSVGGSATYGNKVVRLTASGVLDSSLLPVSATYLGTINLTVTYGLTGTFTAGNYYSVSASGTVDASWSTKLNGAPSTCSAGQSIIFNSNGKWDLVGDTTSSASINGKLDKAGGTMTGALILSGNPTNVLGAVPKQYADLKLALTGGTMTGLLTLSGAPTANLHAATKQYVDGVGSSVSYAFASADTDLQTTLQTNINGKVAKSGDTMTGFLTLSGAPTANLHAATKLYVDTKAGAALQASNNLSDLGNAVTARTNLGLGALATLGTVGTAQITDSSVTNAKIANLTIAGAKLQDGTLTTSKLADESVTTAKIGLLAITTGRIADNAVTGAKIAMGSDAQGDILYFNGTNYARLPAGTSGQFLKTNGAGANPAWGAVSALGQLTAVTLNAFGAETQGIVGIPATANVVYFTLRGVVPNSSTVPEILLGTTGGYATTGYGSSGAYLEQNANVKVEISSTGIKINLANTNNSMSGVVTMVNVTGNVWSVSYVLSCGPRVLTGGGGVDLSGAINRVGLYALGGWASGTIGVSYM